MLESSCGLLGLPALRLHLHVPAELSAPPGTLRGFGPARARPRLPKSARLTRHRSSHPLIRDPAAVVPMCGALDRYGPPSRRFDPLIDVPWRRCPCPFFLRRFVTHDARPEICFVFPCRGFFSVLENDQLRAGGLLCRSCYPAVPAWRPSCFPCPVSLLTHCSGGEHRLWEFFFDFFK